MFVATLQALQAPDVASSLQRHKLVAALQAPSAASLLQCCKFATLELVVMMATTTAEIFVFF